MFPFRSAAKRIDLSTHTTDALVTLVKHNGPFSLIAHAALAELRFRRSRQLGEAGVAKGASPGDAATPSSILMWIRSIVPGKAPNLKSVSIEGLVDLVKNNGPFSRQAHAALAELRLRHAQKLEERSARTTQPRLQREDIKRNRITA